MAGSSDYTEAGWPHKALSSQLLLGTTESQASANKQAVSKRLVVHAPLGRRGPAVSQLQAGGWGVGPREAWSRSATRRAWAGHANPDGGSALLLLRVAFATERPKLAVGFSFPYGVTP